MNIAYIKKLVECNRYGEIIRLIKDNTHMWSINDFYNVYNLCCGTNSTIENMNNYILENNVRSTHAEPCIIYMLEQNIIITDTWIELIGRRSALCSIDFGDTGYCNFLPHYCDSVRLFKHKLCKSAPQDDFSLRKYGPNLLRYFIENRKLNDFKCGMTVPGEYLVYDNSDINYAIVTTINRKNMNIPLINIYSKSEYELGDRLYEMILMTCKDAHKLIHQIYKHKFMYVHIHNRNDIDLCKMILSNGYYVSTMYMLEIMFTYLSLNDSAKYVNSIINRYYTHGEPNDDMYNLVNKI
jgi:hypothetical protein